MGKTVSDLQTGVAISGRNISGTLKYVTGYTQFSSKTSERKGHYLALSIDGTTLGDFSSIQCGIIPSYSEPPRGLVEMRNDPDKNIVIRVTNTDQIVRLKLVSADGNITEYRDYSLSGLTLEPET